jgi:hypothetical protein
MFDVARFVVECEAAVTTDQGREGVREVLMAGGASSLPTCLATHYFEERILAPAQCQFGQQLLLDPELKSGRIHELYKDIRINKSHPKSHCAVNVDGRRTAIARPS